MFGFFNINKPLGMTSHDVVAKVRRTLNTQKVGHAGTLDPLASGVLIVCVGGATRLSDYVMNSTKTYRARVRLGEVTTTYDAEGEIIARTSTDHIQRDDMLKVLSRFLGESDQVPPMYSAIKQAGRKLYDLARAGVEVERPARRITISELELIDWQPPECMLDVTCSAGTYIRSLAFDIGTALGVGAHLSGLIRTRSGTFTLDDAVLLDTFTAEPHPSTYLISPTQALVDYPRIELSPDDERELKYGRTILASESAEQVMAMGYNDAGKLVAVLQSRSDGRLHPIKVFLDS